MKCSKCDSEVNEDSKFCGQCGELIEKRDFVYSEVHKSTQQLWFIIGFLKGACSDEKNKEIFDNFMKTTMKEKCPNGYKDYEEVLKYWRGEIYDMENEKGNGSKRTSIPKVKAVQKNQK